MAQQPRPHNETDFEWLSRIVNKDNRTAGFSEPGTYMLRLQASYGELTGEDTVTLSVGATSENLTPTVDAVSDANSSALETTGTSARQAPTICA